MFTLFNCALAAGVVTGFLERHAGAGVPGGAWRAGSPPALVRLDARRRGELTDWAHGLVAGERSRLDAEYFLCGLFRLLGAGQAMVPPDPLPEWLREALPEARDPGNLRDGVGRLVALCGRSHEHVSRVFRERLGKSPGEWVTGERVRLACRLLETTDMPVTDVAYECGWGNLSHFHRVFKQAMGTTPRGYRQRTRLRTGLG